MVVRGTWTRVAEHESLQRSSHVVSVVGGKAYVFGGELVPRQPRDNHVFEIGLPRGTGGVDAGELVKSIPGGDGAPSSRVGAAEATLGGKLYVFSGRGGQAMAPIEENGRVHCFDPARAEWSVLEPADTADPYPDARSYHCMTGDNHSRLFVHAGCPSKGRLADLWSFDVNDKKWTRHADAPGPQRGGASIAFADGKVYRMNGFDGNTEQGGAVDVFDVASGGWSTVSFVPDGVKSPEARSVASLVPVTFSGRRKLLTLFGERDPSSLGHAGAGKMLGDWWVFDIAGQNWEQGSPDSGNVPAPRGWFDAAVMDEHRVVVAGGLSESNERLKDVWVLSL